MRFDDYYYLCKGRDKNYIVAKNPVFIAKNICIPIKKSDLKKDKHIYKIAYELSFTQEENYSKVTKKISKKYNI